MDPTRLTAKEVRAQGYRMRREHGTVIVTDPQGRRWTSCKPSRSGLIILRSNGEVLFFRVVA